MKQLYIDCGMGAAGDMLTAALLELFDNPRAVLDELNGLGIPGVRYEMEKTVKCGIRGTHVHVYINGEEEEAFHHHHEHGHSHEHDHAHEHTHSGMEEILHLIRHLHVSSDVKLRIGQVYTAIAEAESHVHGVSIQQIHFHEVGTMDAVADVAAVCYLLHKLGVDRVVASPVHVGSGQVHCAHGILPVPAPATAYILQDVPIYSGEIRGELCTPTGAALLKTFVSRFGDMPPMRTEAIGYGMGTKDFPAANCVRVMLGTADDEGDRVLELSCNLDDMTGEAVGYAMEQLLAGGALDVYTTAIGMKKNRPAVMLTVLCRESDRDETAKAIFRLTSTLGIREQIIRRHTLQRKSETVATRWGDIRKKTVWGYGTQRSKYEYDDLAAIAREQGCSIEEIRAELP